MIKYENIEEAMTKIFSAIRHKKPNDFKIYLKRALETFPEGEIASAINKPDWNNGGELVMIQAAKTNCAAFVEALMTTVVLRVFDDDDKSSTTSCLLDVNVRNNQGLTPLHYAARQRNLPMAKSLLSTTHCDPDLRDNLLNQTPLHLLFSGLRSSRHPAKDSRREVEVVVEPEEEQLLFLLLQRSDVNARCGERKETILHRLVSRNGSWSHSVLRSILSDRNDNKTTVDVNIQNAEGETALMTALERDNLEAAKLLLPDANLFLFNKFRETAMHLAARKNQTEILTAILRGQLCPERCVDWDGNTPLHCAAARGFFTAVRLLSDGVDAPVDVKNVRGETPIRMAVEGGFSEVVGLLAAAAHNRDSEMRTMNVDDFSLEKRTPSDDEEPFPTSDASSLGEETSDEISTD